MVTYGDGDNLMIEVVRISAINTTVQSVVGMGLHPNPSHRLGPVHSK